MADDAVPENILDYNSNENSISTKEFLQFEKTCGAYKDSDEEIRLIFDEIKKLSDLKDSGIVFDEDGDDVELILKKAEGLAIETQNLLKSSPISNNSFNDLKTIDEGKTIPKIKVTEHSDLHKRDVQTDASISPSKVETTTGSIQKVTPTNKQHSKETTNDTRRKPKTRPFSASVIETKRKEAVKTGKTTPSPKKNSLCKHEPLIEELKDANERARALELANVQLNEDNKALRKKLDQVNEQKHIADLKIVECEKFISKLGKEFEQKMIELKTVKENEGRVVAELSKERNERKNLTIRHEKDLVVIQDLQRQVKEVEMILRRKHPDSVSALIVASKSSTVEDNKKKLLEERINRLEQELADKENHFQGILMTLQEKFGDMKQKYENHIIDVERQLMEERKVIVDLRSRLGKTNLVDASIQTGAKLVHSTATQTFIKPDRASSAVSRLSQNSTLLLHKLKEDSYLVATIKGLQAELTTKQRVIAKINRETEELKKNLRNLQKEKEVLLHLNPQKKSPFRPSKSSENITARMNSELETELQEAKKQRELFLQEKNSLLESLKKSNEEFIVLKKKRIQDLHTLQLAHEKELMQMNMQLYPLHEEIKLLNRTVEILQERVRDADDKLLKYQYVGKYQDVHAGGDNPGTSRNSFTRRDAR